MQKQALSKFSILNLLFFDSLRNLFIGKFQVFCYFMLFLYFFGGFFGGHKDLTFKELRLFFLRNN